MRYLWLEKKQNFIDEWTYYSLGNSLPVENSPVVNLNHFQGISVGADAAVHAAAAPQVSS